MSVDDVLIYNLNNMKKQAQRMYRIMNTLCNRSVGHRHWRWSLLVLFCAIVFYRMIQFSYIGLMYLWGISVMYLFAQYYTPSGIPDPDEDEFELQVLMDSPFQLRNADADRPLVRALNQFGVWKNICYTTAVGWICTYFDSLNIPFYWPFMLVYFVWLIILTVVKHYSHMKKYGYSMADFSLKKPVYI